MIEGISVADCASFESSSQEFAPLRSINFIFGANGSGKTTLSRVIANPAVFPACKIRWRNDSSMQTRVYNSDFVERVLHPDAELPGVFTLGDDNVEIEKQIGILRGHLSRLESEKNRLYSTLEGENEDDFFQIQA